MRSRLVCENCSRVGVESFSAPPPFSPSSTVLSRLSAFVRVFRVWVPPATWFWFRLHPPPPFLPPGLVFLHLSSPPILGLSILPIHVPRFRSLSLAPSLTSSSPLTLMPSCFRLFYCLYLALGESDLYFRPNPRVLSERVVEFSFNVGPTRSTRVLRTMIHYRSEMARTPTNCGQSHEK